MYHIHDDEEMHNATKSSRYGNFCHHLIRFVPEAALLPAPTEDGLESHPRPPSHIEGAYTLGAVHLI